MSILDDAIREHLELKRAHGADDSELKKLEDEAFGPPQRPDEIDPFAEAPTEFLSAPGEEPAPEPGDEAARGGRSTNVADLQEAPPAGEPSLFDADAPTDAGPADLAPPAEEDELAPAPDAPPPSRADAADVPLPPPPGESPAADLAPPPGEEPAAGPTDEATDAPVGEATDEPEPDAAPEGSIAPEAGPNTEERHAIADQPTQMFDVQAHVDAEVEAPATGEQPSPTDEELVDAAQDEPHAAPPAPEEPAEPTASAPVGEEPTVPTVEEPAAPEQPPLESRGPDAEIAGHPPTESVPEEESAEYDFFNEQRLADELDQALEAPTSGESSMPGYEDSAEGSGIFDFESQGQRYEEDPSEEVLRRHDAGAEPDSEEAPAPEPPSEERTQTYQRPAEEPPSEETPHGGGEPDSEEYAYDPDTGHEDVLEDTPRFLENAPEDDDLWFEQKPPKDFDLD